ncbi:MAG: hypothetical protein J5707_03955 [Candidatus Methanomethylophilus sp.]|nr:hypothetical protein [Methanomethylophilus sp.]
MKGDLSTLKKVCMYGSKVMLAGTFVLLAIAVAVLALGISTFFWDGGKDILSGILGFDTATASDLRVTACFTEYVFVFLLATETVRRIYLVMVSIHKEHSPFNETNTDIVKTLSQIYLIASVVLLVIDILGERGVASAAFMFFGCILLSVVLYIFALIIRYGAVLQNESDHTL